MQDWVDETALTGSRYTYVVTALDRLWNESRPSQVRGSSDLLGARREVSRCP